MSAYYQQLSNAVDQFWLRPILTDILTPPATGQLLIMYSILLRHIFPCYSSCVWGCMGFLYGWCKHLFVSELNNSYLPDKYFKAVCTVAKSYTTVCFDYCLSVAFLNIDISQDSVAPCLRCGGIFKYDFIANLPLSLRVKKVWKSVNIRRSYRQEYGVLFFDWRCRLCGQRWAAREWSTCSLLRLTAATALSCCRQQTDRQAGGPINSSSRAPFVPQRAVLPLWSWHLPGATVIPCRRCVPRHVEASHTFLAVATPDLRRRYHLLR